MSELKPILFNTKMVKAIMGGRKTVTRRICKDANEVTVPDMSYFDAARRTYAVHNYADKEHKEKLSIAERPVPFCPGDILYVRETFRIDHLFDTPGIARVQYRADLAYNEIRFTSDRVDMMRRAQAKSGWRPNENMPKEAARLFLLVTDIHLEKLQNIDGAGIKAEGTTGKYSHSATRGAFSALWDSTIRPEKKAEYGWNANPWVWVIEFKRCKKPGHD